MTSATLPDVPAAQGIILALVPVMVVLAVVVPLPVIPAMIDAFRTEPGVTLGISLAVTMPTLAIAVAGILLGIVGDRVPRRTLLVMGTASYALLAPLPLWIHSLWLLIVSRFLLGLALGAMTVAAVGLVGDYFTGGRRAFWLSAQGSFPAAATIAAALLSGWLGAYGWRAPFLILLAGIPLFAGMLLLRTPVLDNAVDDAAPAMVQGDSVIKWRPLAWIFFLTVLASFMMFAAAYEFGYVLVDHGVRSTALIGLVTAILGAGAVLGALALTKLRRLVPEAQLALCFLIGAAGQLTVALSGGAAGWMVGAAIIGLSQGAIVPVLSLWLLDYVDEQGRGRAVSLFQTTLYLSQFGTPHLARYVAMTHGTATGGMLVYAMSLAGLAIVLGGYAVLGSRRGRSA
ncbi:MFS transporter [Sphingobium sp. HBC34]|uniref:MFS transporter n=1 Tax=Sphingobium cyanobacteriorum TaxID=3063954 RepID=A0ABT8ZPI7_9SPHN|nr:MFS transporter [Sphingobium sp. HBC34]MDO7836416.1 MFS transporter [Sphingobium sp. HBC34]